MRRTIAAMRSLAEKRLPVCGIILAFVILGYCVALAGVGVVFRLVQIWPQTPWEAAIVVEGWRALHKLPVYEAQLSGHATLDYGFAEPFMLGYIFQVVPVSKIVPQAISVASALALAGLATLAFRPRSIAYSVLIGLSFLAIENRIRYFGEGRPDLPAWLLGYTGLAALYLYYQNRLLRYYLAAFALIVAGFAFKQTIAMLSLVPPLALLFDTKRTRTLRDHALGFGPLIGILLVIAFIYLFAKDVFHYMFTVPRAFPINWGAWPKEMWLMLAGAPCLWYALGFALAGGTTLDDQTRQRLAWWSSLLAVTLPLSVLTYVKIGGGPNSLLPVWIAMIGLSWQLLVSREGSSDLQVANTKSARHLFAFSLCVGLTVMPNLTLISRSIGYYSTAWAGKNDKYREVVSYVQALDGIIYSPEDPTILLRAKQRATRSIYTEYDAILVQTHTGWPAELPGFLRTELSRADYIVDVVGAWQDVLRANDLSEMEFTRVWSNGEYEVWRRRPPNAN